MTTVVDNLVKNGHVIREIDPADRRYYQINLTKEGKKLINDLFNTHRQNIILAFEVLSDQEQYILSDYCKRLGTQNLLNNNKEDK